MLSSIGFYSIEFYSILCYSTRFYCPRFYCDYLCCSFVLFAVLVIAMLVHGDCVDCTCRDLICLWCVCVVWLTAEALTIAGGGGKRARGEDVGNAIPTLIGLPAVMDTDSNEIRAMLSKDHINIDGMISGLTEAQLVALDGIVDKYEKTLGSDTAIKSYADFDAELKQIQDRAFGNTNRAVFQVFALFSKVAFENFKSSACTCQKWRLKIAKLCKTSAHIGQMLFWMFSKVAFGNV